MTLEVTSKLRTQKKRKRKPIDKGRLLSRIKSFKSPQEISSLDNNQQQRRLPVTLYKSEQNPVFRSQFSEDIFHQKYAHDGCETWEKLARTLVYDVCIAPDGRVLMDKEDRQELVRIIAEMKFIPGGRYLYYAGRSKKFFNNCFLLRAEHDTREDWARISQRAISCLMTGGGIGVYWDKYRASGAFINGSGGVASGPLAAMNMINEDGRNVMQGGSRRSAIWAALNHDHGDIEKFLVAKNWYDMPVHGAYTQDGLPATIGHLKEKNFNFAAPLDMTNISVNYDTKWLLNYLKTNDPGEVFLKNVEQALSTAEPGFSFNFYDKENEVLRNACTEVTSEDDSDVCNLGSINLGRIESIEELEKVARLGTMFLICGTLRADLPFKKVYEVREKNRRLGLGLMGLHEWLIKRGEKYEVTPELHRWLAVYRGISDITAKRYSAKLGISEPIAKRSIAPTGTIGILAGTTTGIEPIFAVAYKRRFLKGGSKWHYQYVVDSTAQELIELYGVDPESIESSLDLASDYVRRIKFQSDVQQYVDMAISSTINLPKWGSKENNPDKVKEVAQTIAVYAAGLRGLTFYPDGARGGQPLVRVDYEEAKSKLGETFEEHIEAHDVCSLTGKGGVCGI
jgi:ribonucleoside-diphosphate reductase alpha chain